MIGTIFNTYAEKPIEATRTTPESLDIQKLFKDSVDSGMWILEYAGDKYAFMKSSPQSMP